VLLFETVQLSWFQVAETGVGELDGLTAALAVVHASCNAMLIVNRAGEHKQGEMPRAEFEKGVGRKLDLVLPFDARTVAAATNFGQPVAASKGAVANGLRAVTDRLCGAPPASGGAGAGIWQKLLHKA
jgi:pilus assembly protein CpaE